MDLSKTWLIVVSDGDIDYTWVFVAEGASTQIEAQKVMTDIVGKYEDEDDDYSYRVIPLKSLEAFKKFVADDFDEED